MFYGPHYDIIIEYLFHGLIYQWETIYEDNHKTCIQGSRL